MNSSSTCERLSAGISRLFVCSNVGEYDRIRTPYLYPDGDNIDLFCRRTGETISISDLGETTRWLRMQTSSLRRSPRQSHLIEDICLTHGVEFFKGTIVARCRAEDEFASVATRVAQAALRISDLWFTFRASGMETTSEEVAGILADKHLAFERNERLLGRCGRSWIIDFHVRATNRSSLVSVLATGSRSAARPTVDHIVAQWHDLSHLAVGPETLHFVSLFDDTVDVWREEDFQLLADLSTISRLSAPDQLLLDLGADA
ncbi:MAG: DUF1828 domain-containing protein [Phycisphaerae bacterium]